MKKNSKWAIIRKRIKTLSEIKLGYFTEYILFENALVSFFRLADGEIFAF